jgi:hypothetical protein
MKLHPDIMTISYKHRYEIKKAFNFILGIYTLDHFSLDLVRPDGEMIFFSATPSHGYEICSQGYGPYDGAISPEYYENFEFYWWKDVRHKAFSDEINYIREVKHGFKHGFMLVRRWDDFYLIYSFSTKSQDPYFPTLIINKLNELLEAGDSIYNQMRPVYREYTGRYSPPHIDHFYPFEGGEPIPRYTAAYQQPSSRLLLKGQRSSANLQLVVDHTQDD